MEIKFKESKSLKFRTLQKVVEKNSLSLSFWGLLEKAKPFSHDKLKVKKCNTLTSIGV